MAEDFIVPDSSIWQDKESMRQVYNKDVAVRIGIVQLREFIEETEDFRYTVEVFDSSQQIPIHCAMASGRFGGIYNYEEFISRGYQKGEDPAGRGEYAVRPGDVVVVAYANGNATDGLILGSFKHPGRKSRIKPEDGIAYDAEFNGMRTQINNEGEWTLTFRGVPTNIDELDKAPDGSPIPEAEYDEEVGKTFMKFDKTGGWLLSDEASEDPQSVHVDKENGKITVTSGKIVLELDKNSEAVSLTCKELLIEAADAIEAFTTDYAMEASATAKIKSPKIAFGTDGTELLDEITKAIDALGTVQAISPVGPCAPLSAAPQWSQVEQVKSKINKIKGTL